LLVITVLSGYFGFSGFRTLQTKSNEPHLLDISVAILSISTVFYFLYYFKTIGMIWNPVVIYSTIGTLMGVISYDFLRYFIPKSKYQKLWLYEHIFKMIGAFSALLSAFSGTVLYMYKPYSQILPSVFGTLLQIGFIVYYYRKFSKQSPVIHEKQNL
jgi:glucose uptake protein GlcU